MAVESLVPAFTYAVCGVPLYQNCVGLYVILDCQRTCTYLLGIHASSFDVYGVFQKYCEAPPLVILKGSCNLRRQGLLALSSACSASISKHEKFSLKFAKRSFQREESYVMLTSWGKSVLKHLFPRTNTDWCDVLLLVSTSPSKRIAFEDLQDLFIRPLEVMVFLFRRLLIILRLLLLLHVIFRDSTFIRYSLCRTAFTLTFFATYAQLFFTELLFGYHFSTASRSITLSHLWISRTR